MSKYLIEYEFDLRLCDPLLFDMITSCGFNEYPATSTGSVRIKVETDEMPTRNQQVEFIQNACRKLVGTKTSDGLFVLSVKFNRINEAFRCDENEEQPSKTFVPPIVQ